MRGPGGGCPAGSRGRADGSGGHDGRCGCAGCAAPLAQGLGSAEGDPVPIHCEVARQSAESQVCLRRLHIQEACAAMAHCGIKAASC